MRNIAGGAMDVVALLLFVLFTVAMIGTVITADSLVGALIAGAFLAWGASMVFLGTRNLVRRALAGP